MLTCVMFHGALFLLACCCNWIMCSHSSLSDLLSIDLLCQLCIATLCLGLEDAAVIAHKEIAGK